MRKASKATSRRASWSASGCTHAQGYFFSRPLSTQSVEELLEANQPLGPKPVEYAGAALADDPQLYYSTERFDWPKDIPA